MFGNNFTTSSGSIAETLHEIMGALSKKFPKPLHDIIVMRSDLFRELRKNFPPNPAVTINELDRLGGTQIEHFETSIEVYERCLELQQQGKSVMYCIETEATKDDRANN